MVTKKYKCCDNQNIIDTTSKEEKIYWCDSCGDVLEIIKDSDKDTKTNS